MDSDIVVDLWAQMLPYIQQKDRLEAADALVAVFDEYGVLSEMTDASVEFDKDLKAAVVSLYGIRDTEEEDDEYD